MKRRTFLLTGLGVGAAATATGAALAVRWRRTPFLTDAHLKALTQQADRPGLRTLFVGNSFTLMHDMPARVEQAAVQDGIPLRVAMAAATGARLVETFRIPAFRDVLDHGWDILVLQDFSTTCLRGTDRVGSAWAMRQMVRRARPRQVMLYPTWAFPPQHRVYRDGAGRLAYTPTDPEDFAQRITAHYARVAQHNGWIRAPVTESLLPDITPYLGRDIHHLNTAGAERVTDVLWNSLRPALQSLSANPLSGPLHHGQSGRQLRA